MLALLLLVQSFVPVVSRASNDSLNKGQERELVKVGELDIDSYPKLDNKTILAIQKQARENKKLEKRTKGSGLFSVDSPYLPGQNPTDEEKAAAYGNLNVDFKVFGLKENGTEKEFQWNEIFGTDSNGKPGTADIYFVQRDAETNAEIHRFKLTVNKAGEYKLLDIYGKPANLPLYSTALKPYKYDVELDIGVSEKVMFLTVKLSYSGNKVASFTKDADGNIIADIPLDLQLAQIASTKFVSEWKTDVEESIRPAVNGDFDTLDNQDLRYFPFPKNDTDELKLRMESYNLETDDWPGYDPQTPPHLRVIPKVSVEEDMLEDPATYEIDKDKSRITANGKTYKYDLKYDVINGGKLTMTEIIPLTFDANGGKFASITDPAVEQKIVKEVEYEKDLTDSVEKPKKERETFKGWSDTKGGTTPVSDDVFKNIKEAKTFYAIWDNNDIQAEELEIKESFKDGDTWVNDFIPSLEILKGQVKIKDASGNPQSLANDDTFAIVDGTNEYKTDAEAKDYLYNLLKEDDATEVSRNVTLKAKVTHKKGTSQTVDIPIKVIKNIYEAKTEEGKPVYVPNDYVKVTVDPTTKAKKPQKYFYYVNPAAKVVIPGSNPTATDGYKFTKWTMKADTATGDGTEYKLVDKPRKQFKVASTITAQYEKEGKGIINIKYVDENGKEIDAKYHKDGVDYPATKDGKLGAYATEQDFPKPGPDFKGYIFSGRDSLKGKQYKDQSGPDKLDTVKYSYFKKVTTEDKSTSYNHFKVVFDGNGGKFGTDTTKDVYVYFDGNSSTPETVTFAEVREAVKEAYGKPSKTNEYFIEWQDNADKGTKVADNYVITVPVWDRETYPDDGYVPETFYAHYGKASAKIAYLDLDGKAIADKFKIDGVEYPTEKEGTAGEAIANDVFTAETAPKFTGYKFNRIELNPKDGKYAIDKKATIKIYYEEVPDVIPANPDGSNPDEVPADYVRVEFVPTEKGTLEGNKIFFVNPKKEVTITVKDPVGKDANTFVEWKIGKNAEGEKYTPSTPKKFENDTTITAVYTTDVIEQKDPNKEPDEKPEGTPENFVKVTVQLTDKALVKNDQDEELTGDDYTRAITRIFWVNPNKEVTLPVNKPDGKNVAVSDDNTKEFTWKFTKWTSNEKPVRTWDENIDDGIVGTFTEETTITANYKEVVIDQGNVSTEGLTVAESFKDGETWVNNFIPSEDDLKNAIKVKDASGTEQNVPDDANVEFVLGNDASGTAYVDLAAELYDKLKEKTETEVFRRETIKAKVTFANKEVQEVEIPIKVIKNIYEAKTEEGKPNYVPEGYVKVTVDPTIKAEKPQKYFYYVNPEAKVLIPGSDPKAISGFQFVNWTIPGKDTDGNDIDVPYKLTERHQFEKETTIRANYANEKDIIEFDPKKPVAKPEGFITVSFDADLGLKLTDIKFYHVKKNATDTNGKLLTLAALTKPKYQAANGYAFDSWDKPDTTPIGDQDIVVTALAKQASSPDKPGDEPGYRPSYPEIIYRDRIVEKEKIVEKIVKVGENDELLKEIRYMQGYNGKFRPYDGLTRAEAAQILANALKADGYRYDANYALSYTDVGNKWYTDAVRVVTQANVFQGYSDGTFRPQSKITRAEWVATLRRFQDLKEANGNAMMLRSGHWATAEVQAAYEAGWLGVYQDGTAHFDADKPITRQEVAYVSNRAFRRVLDKVYLRRSVNTLLTYKDINPSMPLYEDILCASNTLLTDNKYYKANTIVMDNVTFNIVTDYMTITQKKFQYNVNR